MILVQEVSFYYLLFEEFFQFSKPIFREWEIPKVQTLKKNIFRLYLFCLRTVQFANVLAAAECAVRQQGGAAAAADPCRVLHTPHPACSPLLAAVYEFCGVHSQICDLFCTLQPALQSCRRDCCKIVPGPRSPQSDDGNCRGGWWMLMRWQTSNIICVCISGHPSTHTWLRPDILSDWELDIIHGLCYWHIDTFHPAPADHEALWVPICHHCHKWGCQQWSEMRHLQHWHENSTLSPTILQSWTSSCCITIQQILVLNTLHSAHSLLLDTNS